MDERQQRGIEIANTLKIQKRKVGGFIVPSQTGDGAYVVKYVNFKPVCECPDCELNQQKCKHIWAVETLINKKDDGTTEITRTVKKRTYSQNWTAYNKAQNSEIEKFPILLKDLVNSIDDRKQSRGRPRLSDREQFFCAIEKVYSQLSSRRAYSIYRDAKSKKQINKTPNFNAINKFLNRDDITPHLQKLLTISALPLKAVETDFAIDSSGFTTSQFNDYVSFKYGTFKKRKWIKAHILIGAKTNVIASARITGTEGADSPYLETLITEAKGYGFDLKEVSADKAYSSMRNLDVIDSLGAKPYIPFKSNATAKARHPKLWKKMFHYFMYMREDFLQHYHKRSNVETAFMMIKAKFGERLKSKNRTAQINELLCKLIAHNIVVLIHEMEELGIGVDLMKIDRSI